LLRAATVDEVEETDAPAAAAFDGVGSGCGQRHSRVALATKESL
jgi:hypothetical protein